MREHCVVADAWEASRQPSKILPGKGKQGPVEAEETALKCQKFFINKARRATEGMKMMRIVLDKRRTKEAMKRGFLVPRHVKHPTPIFKEALVQITIYCDVQQTSVLN